MTVIYEILEICDEVLPESVDELNFIKDNALRDEIRRDLHEAAQALESGYWKSCCVLAGAAIERLMYELLSNDAVAVEKNVKEKNFLHNAKYHSLITKLEEKSLPLQNKEANNALLINLKAAADARNLIHPAREERLKKKCSEGDAFTTLGALKNLCDAIEQSGIEIK